jgi:hypothetical protein
MYMQKNSLWAHCAVLTFLLAVFSSEVKAQQLWDILHYGDSLLSMRYHHSNIDTAYITRPQTKWTLRARLNVSGASLEVESMAADDPFKSHADADFKSTLSLGVSYLGLSVALALNPAKMMGKYKDYELNLRYYGNRWGFDFIYQDARNFTGWREYQGVRDDLPAEMLRLKTLNVNFYYAFNKRRFSYPAAFSQSYIQRRSAGSFLLAASGQGQVVETKGDYESRLNVSNIGIGAGYGYNWVPGRNWLLHISALPTFIVYSHTSLKAEGQRTTLKYQFPETIITARGAIVRQFGNMFVGTTMVYNYTNIGNRDHLSVYNSKWRTRLFFGIRL